MNSADSLLDNVIFNHTLCDGWTNNTEGAIYHLGNTILFLGYMGGSGAYGALYIFSFLIPAFLCLAMWGWLTVCGLDVFIWNLLLMLQCLAQVCHLIFRLMQDGLSSEELSALYTAVFLPLDVPQVTLTAETDCQYISWRRRRLYLLLSKDRYIARLFSVMLGSDIADKLYSLNDKLFAKSGVRLDIRLPSLYHVLAPSPPGSERGSASSPPRGNLGDSTVVIVDPAPSNQASDGRTSKPEHGKAPASKIPHQLTDTEMPSGFPLRVQRRCAPLAPTDTPKL